MTELVITAVDEPDELGGVILPCHEWGATFTEYFGTTMEYAIEMLLGESAA